MANSEHFNGRIKRKNPETLQNLTVSRFFLTEPHMSVGGDKRDRTADLLNAMSATREQNEF